MRMGCGMIPDWAASGMPTCRAAARPSHDLDHLRTFRHRSNALLDVRRKVVIVDRVKATSRADASRVGVWSFSVTRPAGVEFIVFPGQRTCHAEDAGAGLRLTPTGVHVSRKQIFVERRPEGDYAVRKPNSKRASAVAPTQAKAIELARQINPGVAPLVERVRFTTGGKPDKWRKP